MTNHRTLLFAAYATISAIGPNLGMIISRSPPIAEFGPFTIGNPMDPDDIKLAEPPRNAKEFWEKAKFCMHCHTSGFEMTIVDSWDTHLDKSPMCKVSEMHGS